MQSSVVDIVHFQKWIYQTYFKIIEHGFQNLRWKEFFVSVWSVLSTSVNPKYWKSALPAHLTTRQNQINPFPKQNRIKRVDRQCSRSAGQIGIVFISNSFSRQVSSSPP